MTPLSPEELTELDRRHHLHPFTNHAEMHELGTQIIVSGDGVYVKDARGRKLLDGLAGLWCVNVGYGCAPVIEAICQQVAKLPFYPSFLNSTNEPAIRLADRLTQLAPGRLTRVAFCNSGSEANETALKMIRAWRKLRGEPHRTKILSRTWSYHGVTMATTSMTGLASCYTPFDLPLPGFIHVPGPYSYADPERRDPETFGKWCLEETARIIEREGPETVAALFAEPIQGAGGVIVPPPGYLRGLRELCRHHGVLFVADEVITGFGRLGDWFASGLWNLDPDLIILAKGLTSGYIPMGATMASAEIAADLSNGGYFAHGFTYSGHPVAAAAALATIDVLETQNIIPTVRDDIGPFFQEKLLEFQSHPAVAEVRGFGLIGAMEIVPAPGQTAPTNPLGVKAAAAIREEGVIVRGIRDLIAISPALTITRSELDVMFDGIRRGLDKLAR